MSAYECDLCACRAFRSVDEMNNIMQCNAIQCDITQESMSPPTADMICGHLYSRRASQAPTVIRPNNGVGLVCSRRLTRLRLIGRPLVNMKPFSVVFDVR